MISGTASAEARFFGMKVCHRSGGFPIGEPCIMLLTKRGNSLVISVLASAWHQPSGMYREVCIYRTDTRSVFGESFHPMGSVTTEGTGVGQVVEMSMQLPLTL